MKKISRLTGTLILSFTTLAGAKTLTTDPLTGLPLYPATDSRLHLGNEPTRLPDSQICKSKMQVDFYVVYDSTVNTTDSWYASHLSGFHKVHAYVNHRSQDTFYNSDGTLIVSVTGEPGNDGEDTDTHGIVYGHFQPALREKTILSMGKEKIVCD
ncbi:MAG TPA: hypothetical protein VHZ28_09445 [Terracidiphilus sp.]|jgi:hypothetical protein|nr:hypothetical protein [Terracidiphilus sp.]HEX4285308.1 hypothetical protein [Terracidiphilus sp.]